MSAGFGVGALQGGVLASFVALSTEDQVAVASSFMVALPQDSEIRAMMLNGRMDRLEILRGASPPQSMPMVVSNHSGRRLACVTPFPCGLQRRSGMSCCRL